MKDWIYCEVEGRHTLIITVTKNGVDHNLALAISEAQGEEVIRLRNRLLQTGDNA